MHEGGLFQAVLPLLQELEAIQDRDLLHHRLERIRKKILDARMPGEIEQEVLRLAVEENEQAGWAVRSSAEGEDGHFSFAGQFESVLNVQARELLSAYRRVVQSRFQPRAYLYRRGLHLQEIDTPMAVLFLALVEARSAGVLYTRDPNNRDRDSMLIQSVWGLAQDLVTGGMDGDQFCLARSRPRRCSRSTSGRRPAGSSSTPQGGLRAEQVAGEEADSPEPEPEGPERALGGRSRPGKTLRDSPGHRMGHRPRRQALGRAGPSARPPGAGNRSLHASTAR